MLKEYSSQLRYSLVIVDFILFFLAFVAAYLLRAGPLLPFFKKPLAPLSEYRWLLLYLTPFVPFVLRLSGCYRPFRRQELTKMLGHLLWGVLMLSLVGMSLIFLRQSWIYSRALFLLWQALYLGLAILARIGLLLTLRYLRARGYNTRNIAIVGAGEMARRVISELKDHDHWGLRTEGVIVERGASAPSDVPVLGSLEDIERILRDRPIDDVFYTLGEDHPALPRVATICATLGCSLYVVPKDPDNGFRLSAESLGRLPVLAYRRVPAAHVQLFVKRLIDLLVSAVALTLFPFIYLIVGLAIKLDSPGPVFYVSTRVGHNRRRFRCYKFRTMVKDADRMIHLLDQVNELRGPIRKSARDPRITRVGRFLRRWSIDEIPQFINVFKGEMSLVGPRPPTPDEVERYRLSDLRKLSMPQGITGLWQVSGRDAIKDFEERLRLDLKYIDNWSLWLDLKIIAKTFVAIFKGAS